MLPRLSYSFILLFLASILTVCATSGGKKHLNSSELYTLPLCFAFDFSIHILNFVFRICSILKCHFPFHIFTVIGMFSGQKDGHRKDYQYLKMLLSNLIHTCIRDKPHQLHLFYLNKEIVQNNSVIPALVLSNLFYLYRNISLTLEQVCL